MAGCECNEVVPRTELKMYPRIYYVMIGIYSGREHTMSSSPYLFIGSSMYGLSGSRARFLTITDLLVAGHQPSAWQHLLSLHFFASDANSG